MLASFELVFGLVWTYLGTILGSLSLLGLALYGHGLSPFASSLLFSFMHAMLVLCV